MAQGESLSAKRTTRPAKSSRRLAATRRHRRVARQHRGWHMTSVTRPLARRSRTRATEVGAYPTGNRQYICKSGRAAAPLLSLCSTRQQSQCTCASERDAQSRLCCQHLVSHPTEQNSFRLTHFFARMLPRVASQGVASPSDSNRLRAVLRRVQRAHTSRRA